VAFPFKNKVTLVSIVPSLDTPVCEMQTYKLSTMKLDPAVDVVTVSRDLPMAQARFAREHQMSADGFVSDYKSGAFGKTTGLMMKEKELLARGVAVLDKTGVIRHLQIVPEVSHLPDLDKAVQLANALASEENNSTMEVNDKVPVESASQEGGETLDAMKERIGFDKVWPSEKLAHDFVGVKKCSLCHKTDKQGSQFKIWEDSPHAKAYDTLGMPEAKALAAKLGIADPQQSGKCLRCHSTAYAFGEDKVTENIPVEEGVSCETCHGPGKDYMKITTMKDRAKAVQAGLVIPGEATCLKCHNETAPNVKPFHYQESWDKIKHPVPGE